MQLMKKKLNKYTTSIPPVYHQYTTSIPWYTASIPWYTASIPWYTGRIPWYTGGILVSYHQYSTNAFTGLDQEFCFHMMVQLKFFSMSVSRLLCIALPCIALHYIVLSEARFNLKLTALRSMRVQWLFFLVFSLRLLCIALHCIASHCSIWSAFQFKADSTEIYETSMNMFLLVFNLKCIPIKTQQHWDLRELWFFFQHVMHFSLSLRFALHSEEHGKKCPRWNQIHLGFVNCFFKYLGKGITKLWIYVCGWRFIGFNGAVTTASM